MSDYTIKDRPIFLRCVDNALDLMDDELPGDLDGLRFDHHNPLSTNMEYLRGIVETLADTFITGHLDMEASKRAVLHEMYVRREQRNQQQGTPTTQGAVRLHSLVTKQGTAIPEATLCDDHGFNHGFKIVENAPADADMTRGFVDTTDNPEVKCVVCGRTGVRLKFVNVNEEGEPYGEHDNITAAVDNLVQFPNDHIVVTIA